MAQTKQQLKDKIRELQDTIKSINDELEERRRESIGDWALIALQQEVIDIVTSSPYYKVKSWIHNKCKREV